MFPPLDSLQHQTSKLAEAMSKINTATVPPPPAYSMTSNGNAVADTTHEENDDVWSTPAPISIQIDASVSITGNHNTIVLPPCLFAPSSTTNLDLAPDRQAVVVQGRAECLTATLLRDLKESGLISSDVFDNQSWPLNIRVNASTSIKGERNVICAGVPKKAKDEQQMNSMKSACNYSRKRRAQSVCSYFATKKLVGDLAES